MLCIEVVGFVEKPNRMKIDLRCGDGSLTVESPSQLRLLIEQCGLFRSLLSPDNEMGIEEERLPVIFPPNMRLLGVELLLQALDVYDTGAAVEAKRAFLERTVLLDRGMAEDNRLVTLLLVVEFTGHEQLRSDIGAYLYRTVCVESNEEDILRMAGSTGNTLSFEDRLEVCRLMSRVAAFNQRSE